MPEGEIKFVISGDSSKYEQELNRIRIMADETKTRIDKLYQQMHQKDVTSNAMVKDSIDKAEIELINVKSSIKEQSGELDELEIKRKETETRVRFTVSGMLLGLRAVTDVAALVSVVTGEQIDVQFLSMISMGITAVMQVQLQAAVYAATPGMQPFALMLLAMIPMLTGMIGYIKAQEMKVQALIDKSHQNQLDALLEGVYI